MGKRTMEHKIREGIWLKKGTVQRKKAKFGIMMSLQYLKDAGLVEINPAVV